MVLSIYCGTGLLPPGEEGTDSPAVVDDIDGEPFINDDGSGYIFWRRRNAGRLSADRLHLDGEPVTLATARQGYSEGPVMFKRKGIYYYIYTLSGHQNYVNAYMMSRESPLTGFVKPEGNDIFYSLLLKIKCGDRDMATCFMTRERMNIFFSIWNTEMAELPVKCMLTGWNLMTMER